MQNTKINDTNKLAYKTERDSQTQKMNLWLPRERNDQGDRMHMYTLLYLTCVTNKDLLYSTWNSAQRYVAAWMGGGFGEE